MIPKILAGCVAVLAVTLTAFTVFATYTVMVHW